MGKGNRRRRNHRKYFFMGSDSSQKKEKKDKPAAFKHKTQSHSYADYSTSWNTGNAKPQQVSNPENVIHTDKGTFEFVNSAAWGTVLIPVIDPKAHKVSLDELNGIKLINDFPKISKETWARWIALCFHFCPDKPVFSQKPTIHKVWDSAKKNWDYYKFVGGERIVCSEQEYEVNKTHFPTTTASCHSGDLEVSMLLCRKLSDLSQWRVLIPKQTVTGGSVNADLSETIDIETGERFKIFPPPGWCHAGSSHSHNTMAAFFSSIDDKSELTVPGLHIVVGRIDKKKMEYEHKSSIVLRQLRKKIDLFDVVDPTPVNDVTFHGDVLEYITKKDIITTSYTSYAGHKWNVYDDDDDLLQDDHVNPGYVAWKKKQEKEKKDYAEQRSVMGFHMPDKSQKEDSERCGADTDIFLPAIDFDDQQLAQLTTALETSISQGEKLNLDEIADYYDRVNLSFDPEEWWQDGI